MPSSFLFPRLPVQVFLIVIVTVCRPDVEQSSQSRCDGFDAYLYCCRLGLRLILLYGLPSIPVQLKVNFRVAEHPVYF